MYLIKHIKNNNYYHSRITNGINHYVYSEKQAHNFKSKAEANKFLQKFNHPEHFEIIKYNV